jgi:putative endonuclease
MSFHVYIVASLAKTLYTGVTSDLRRRIHQHRTGEIAGFTARYRVNRLVHFEAYEDIRDAKKREKQIKGWRRERKLELIEAANPEWEDLADRIGLPASSTVAAGSASHKIPRR